MSKVMISLAPEFLRKMDGLAKAEHRSRSELVREAIRTYLVERVEPRAGVNWQESRRAATRILNTKVRWPKGETAVSIVRNMRETRYGSHDRARH